jgi:hypothetical protein
VSAYAYTPILPVCVHALNTSCVCVYAPARGAESFVAASQARDITYAAMPHRQHVNGRIIQSTPISVSC